MLETASTRAGGLVLATYAAAVTIGGANFLAVRFSNRELDPFWGAGLRFSLAAVLFVMIVLALRLPWPRSRQLFLTAVYGLLGFAAFYALMYRALTQITAGVATVVLAIVPLVTVLLATIHRLETLRRQALLGSGLALTGILWMVMGTEEVVLPPTALLAMLAASVYVGESVIVGKKLAGNHPAVTNAVGMVVGALALLGMSIAVGETWAWPRRPDVVWSIAYLATVGSVGLFVLVLLVVRQWSASATSYMFVLFPLVTMLLGAWLADEPLAAPRVIGAVLVMAGVWFGALAPAYRHVDAGGTVERTPPILESG